MSTCYITNSAFGQGTLSIQDLDALQRRATIRQQYKIAVVNGMFANSNTHMVHEDQVIKRVAEFVDLLMEEDEDPHLVKHFAEQYRLNNRHHDPYDDDYKSPPAEYDSVTNKVKLPVSKTHALVGINLATGQFEELPEAMTREAGVTVYNTGKGYEDPKMY